MSYDIHLLDPVTKETAKVPGHLMIGGTYKADYHPDTGTFTPALNTEADLNITYNYGGYYKEIYEEGIRTIYGMSGVDSINILEKMIEHIRNTYQVNGTWICTKRTITIYYDENNQPIEDIIEILRAKGKCREEKVEIEVNEGDTSDYWKATTLDEAVQKYFEWMAGSPKEFERWIRYEQ